MTSEAPLWNGYEIVCPDGLVRHYPYTNEDDARCDAGFCTKKRCQVYKEPSPLEKNQPPCPGGQHEVRPVVFVPTPGSEPS